MNPLRKLLAVTSILAAALVLVDSAAAQNFALQADSKLWVDGTSTRSDWTVHATEMDGNIAVDGATNAPNSLKFTVAAPQIKSNNSTIMDRLMHEALKVDEHQTITFELVDAVPSDEGLHAKGRLTLGGVTNEIEMNVASEQVDGGAVRYTGSTPLKMTDFDLEPPVAMFGALRTADDVTVHFDVVFAPEN